MLLSPRCREWVVVCIQQQQQGQYACTNEPCCSTPTQMQQQCRWGAVCLLCFGAEDAELEQRLAALRRAKGATPDGEGSKAKKRTAASSSSSSSSKKQGVWEGVAGRQHSGSVLDRSYTVSTTKELHAVGFSWCCSCHATSLIWYLGQQQSRLL